MQKVAGGRITKEQDLIDAVKDRLSGDLVLVRFERNGKVIELPLPLGPKAAHPGADQNYRADDFPTVFDCAVPFFSNECGGPIVDLTGRAIGIAIARVGPHDGLAIPGDCVQRLLPDLQTGRLARHWTPSRSAGK